MTLAEFYAARLDEDERTATRAAECGKMRLTGAERGLPPGDWSWLADYGQPQPGDIALVDHQVRFDPARVLREVEAGRKILAEYKAVTKLAGLTEKELGFLGWYREWVLKNLATVYDGHPDYEESWRP